MYADSWVLFGVLAGDLCRAIGTAIIDDDIVPVLIRLGTDAIDAFRQVLSIVVHRRNNTDQRLELATHWVLLARPGAPCAGVHHNSPARPSTIASKCTTSHFCDSIRQF